MEGNNIAFIHGNFPSGGAERITIDIIRQLHSSEYGFRFYIFAHVIEEDKISDEILQYARIIRLEPDSDDPGSHSRHIARLIAEHGIQVVVSVSIWEKDIEKTAREHGCRLIYCNHGMPFWEKYHILDMKDTLSRKNLLRRLLWLTSGRLRYDLLGKARRKTVEMYRYRYNSCDRYVVLSETYRSEIESELGIDHGNSRITAIYNPSYTEDNINFDKRRQIIFVGRLSRFDKRVDRLMKIWAYLQDRIPDYELLIIGDGPEMARLQKLKARLRLRNISFEGHRNNVREYYRDASVLALVSTHEGWPLCLTEAQANGVIPVAFGSSGGIREILSPDGVNGFIVKPFRKRDFAHTILKITQMTEKDRMAVRHNAILKSKEHTTGECGRRWADLLMSLLNN